MCRVRAGRCVKCLCGEGGAFVGVWLRAEQAPAAVPLAYVHACARARECSVRAQAGVMGAHLDGFARNSWRAQERRVGARARLDAA